MKLHTLFSSRLGSCAVAAMKVFALFFACSAFGQGTFTWNGGGGDNFWTTGGNWGGTAPGSPQAFLNFDGTTRVVNTNNFNSGSAGYQLYFKSTAGAFTLYGNSITFFDFGGGTPNIQNEGTATQTVSFPFVHSGNANSTGLMKINGNTGSGGPITFNGAISAGATTRYLKMADGGGTGLITFNGVLSDGTGQLQLQQGGTAASTTILTAANTYSGGTVLFSGNVQLNTGGILGSGDVPFQGTADLVFNETNSLSVNNRIYNNGTPPALIQNGSGTTTLGGSADNSGAAVTINAGTVVLNKASSGTVHALGGGTNFINNGGTLQLGGTGGDQIYDNTVVDVNGGGTFDLNGRNETISTLNFVGAGVNNVGALINSSASLATLTLTNSGFLGGPSSVGGAGNILLNGTAPLTAGSITFLTNLGPDTFEVTNGIGVDNINVHVVAAGGTVVLAKPNTSQTPSVHGAGQVLIENGGTVQLGGTGGFEIYDGQNSTNFTGGVLDLNGQNQTFSGTGNLHLNGTGIAGSGALINSSSTASTIFGTNPAGILFLDSASSIGGAGNLTISGVIAGTGSLIKVGAGTLTLSSNSAYAGNTTISVGTLALSGGGSVAGSPNVIIAGGATLDVTGLATPLTLGNSQTLKASGSTSSGTINVTSGNGLALGNATPLAFTAFTPAGSGGAVPLALSGAGTMTLGASSPVTVTVSNGGTALAAGSYKLIATGASGTVATVPTGTLVVNGDGVALGTSTSLAIVSGELYLNVISVSLAYHAGSSSPSVYGSPVSFDATVTPDPGDGTSVTFLDGANTLGTANTVGGIATFTTAATQLSAGGHTITATYNNATSAAINHTVNQRPVALTGGQTYDGLANIPAANLTIANNLDGGNLTLSGTAGLSSKDVGTPGILAGTLSLGGSAAGNYTLTGLTGTASVTQKALTYTGVTVPASKIYDATTTASPSGTPALQSSEAAPNSTSDGAPYTGDTVSISGLPSASYNNATVAGATTATFSIGTLSLSGAQANDYSITVQGTQAATVIQKPLTYSGVTVPASKVYDATTTATPSGTASLPSSESPGSGSSADGKPYTGDVVSLTGTATAVYNVKDVTANTVTFSGISLTGSSSGNYSLTSLTQAATISQKPLAYSGPTAPPTKVYDGTTTAILGGSAPALQSSESPGSGSTSDGAPYTGDTVSLTGSPAAAYTTKDTTATTVTFGGVLLAESSSADYSLTPLTQAATITQKGLSYTGVSVPVSKVYDATTMAAPTGTPALQLAEAPGNSISDGVPYTGDTVSISGLPTAGYNNSTVAGGTTVTFAIGTLGLSGAQAGDYSINVQGPQSATITQKPLTYSGPTVPASKVYDGTTNAIPSGTPSLQASDAPGTGSTADGRPYTGDVVSLTGSPTAAYNVKNTSATTVNFSGVSLAGASSSNYSLTPLTQAATISQKALTYSGVSVPATKVYDGTTTAFPTGTPALPSAENPGTGTTSDGIPCTGDTVSIGGLPSANYNSANVATANTVTFGIGTLSLSGSQAGDYSIAVQGSQAATILPPFKITDAGNGHATAGVGDQLTISAVDNSGAVMSGVNGTFTVVFSGMSAGPDGSLPTVTDENGTPQTFGSPTVLNFVNGAANSGGEGVLVAHKAETTSPHVTDGVASDGSTGGSTVSIAVVAGADAAYRISAATATPAVGAGDALTIGIVDQYQNPSSFSGNKAITFAGLSAGPDGSPATVSDKIGNAVNFGTATTITFSSGVNSAGGSLVAHKVESNKQLTASDGILNATGPIGTAPTLSPVVGSAARLGITTQPSSAATAGVAFATQPVVTVSDLYGNLEGTSSASINVSPSVGNLGGPHPINAVSGVATFSGLLLTNAGPNTLTFTSPGLVSTNSTLITVSGAPYVALAWVTQPAGAVYRTVFGTQPVLATVDQYGNPTTSGLAPNVPVTVSMTSGPGALSGTTNYNIGSSGNNGVINFTDLSISGVSNNFILTATAPLPASSTPPVTGMAVWLDASDTNSIVANSSAVTQWNDKSGNHYNFGLQEGSGAIAYTNTLNGKPVVTFPQGPALLTANNAYTFSGSSMTLFCMVRHTTNAPFGAFEGPFSSTSGGSDNGSAGSWAIDSDYPPTTRFTRNGTSAVVPNNYMTAGTPFVWEGADDGVNNLIYSGYYDGMNSNLTSQATSAEGPFAITQLSVGARLDGVNSLGLPWNGDVAEVLLYNSFLTPVQQGQIYNYLYGKWVSGGGTPFSTATAPFTVAPAPLTITGGITANSKAYDGTTNTTLTIGMVTFSGVFAPDNGDVGVNASGAVGYFANAGPGNDIPVTVTGITTTGTAAGDYVVLPLVLSANITGSESTYNAFVITNGGPGNLTVGAGSQLIIETVDNTGAVVTGINGNINVTFSGLANGNNSSPPTVTDKNGNPVAFGTSMTLNFINGVASAAGEALLAPQKAQTAAVHITDGTHTDASTGGSTISLTVVPASVTVTLNSSENPSGYRDSITFTATESAQAGSIVFATNGVTFDTEPLSSGSATSVATTALARGNTPVTATYTGNSDYAGQTNLVQMVTNHPPVLNAANYTRIQNLELLIKLSDLLTNASDVDGDTLSLGYVTPSTNGTTLTSDATYIYYTNSSPGNVSDAFKYYVNDGFGGLTTNTVFITVDVTQTGQPVLHVHVAGGQTQVSFNGLPGCLCYLQRSTNLTGAGAGWVYISTNTTSTNVQFNIIDTFPDIGSTPPISFYKVLVP